MIGRACSTTRLKSRYRGSDDLSESEVDWNPALTFHLGGSTLRRRRNILRSPLLAAAIGALAGLLIAMMGGKLLGGSLALLAESFPDARLQLDPLGPFAASVTNTLEGAWFTLCLAGALMLARR